MASLMVGIGNGTTSTPMFVLQLLLWSESVTMVQSISQIGRMASKWIDGFLSCRERKCDFSYLTAAAICEASTSDAIGSGSWHGNAGSPCLHIQLLLCHLQLPMGPKASSSALGAVQPEQRRFAARFAVP
ncbi:uncharacterized protein [Oryza sativa Japonica Group]|uniref:uncharacterized protein isoform X2 n=1 Tax=Oryza sativa subsp. japonica TaxID=39947 RepID=UPI00339D23A9